MKKNSPAVRDICYILGLALIALGVAISKRSGLGVSPVSSVPFTLTEITGIGITYTTMMFQFFCVVLQAVLLGKAFKLKSILQVPAGILFGLFNGLCVTLVNAVLPDPALIAGFGGYAAALVMLLGSTVIIAFGLFFYVPADIIPLATEGAMLAISQKSSVKFSTVKILFDVGTVLTAFIGCCFLAGSLTGGIELRIVGIGTVIAAVLVGVDLKIINRFLGKYRNRFLESGTGTE